MKRAVLAVILTASGLLAQSLSLSVVGNGPVRAGSTVQVQLSLTGSSGLSLAAWQATVRSTTGGTWTIADGPAATAAGKAATCATVNGYYNCVQLGMSTATLLDGVLATYSLAIPANATPGQSSIILSAQLGASLAGDGVALAVAPLNFTLAAPISPCDVTGDGLIDHADVTAVIAQVIGLMPPLVDLDQDGHTTAVDVVRVINAANGGACRVGR